MISTSSLGSTRVGTVEGSGSEPSLSMIRMSGAGGASSVGSRSIDPRRPVGRVLRQCSSHDRAERFSQRREVGLGRQVLHQHLGGGFPLERHPAGDHLVEDDPHRVDVDRLVVLTGGDLRRHVVAGADVLGHPGVVAMVERLGEPVIADLDDPVLEEQVGRLQVSVDDAVVVQVGDAFDQPLSQRRTSCGGRPSGCSARMLRQALARRRTP